MGTAAHTRAFPAGTEVFHRILAEQLRIETSPEDILKCLMALGVLLSDDQAAKNVSLIFLQADGLATLIRHLRGSPTSDGTPDQGSTSCAIADEAAAVYFRWHSCGITDELSAATHLIPSAIQALCDAPTMLARSVALQVLHVHAPARPAACEAMIEAGVIEHLIAFYAALYNDTRGPPWGSCDALDVAGTAALLVKALMCWGSGVADKLRQATCELGTINVLAALLLVQVWHSCSS
jgi:hypothetical protein